jgi:hypothetical protein
LNPTSPLRRKHFSIRCDVCCRLYR